MQKIRVTKSPKTGDQRDYSLVHRQVHYIGEGDANTPVKNTMGAVPREEANIEVEGGETVIGDVNRDGYLEHMTFVGKRHSQGGVPVNIPEGSFIFSDTKKLRIKDKEVLTNLFGLPAKKQGYTPAEIAKRYQVNNYIQDLKNPDTDPVTKRSATEMLKNNMEKLGQLALIQESMKGFPDGVPAIAESAMAALQPEQEATPQARYGGKMQRGGTSTPASAKDNAKGYWDRVMSIQTERDPRAQEALEKIIPFYGKEADGFGDWLKTVFTTPQNEVNHILTGYYESPMTTVGRYNKISDTQKFWGDLATDPMMYPELPVAGMKGIANFAAKGLPYAEQAAAITAKYGKKGFEALSKYIGKVPFEKLMEIGLKGSGRITQAGMHLPGEENSAAPVNSINVLNTQPFGTTVTYPSSYDMIETLPEKKNTPVSAPAKTQVAPQQVKPKATQQKTQAKPAGVSNEAWEALNEFEDGGMMEYQDGRQVANTKPDPNAEIAVGTVKKNGKTFYQFVKGSEKYVKDEQGNIVARAPRTDGDQFSQYGSNRIQQILAKDPNVVYTNTNFGSFGNQPRFGNTGVYLSSTNAKARKSGDLSPEEWADFQKRHGDWIDQEYSSASGKGLDAFKKDLISGKVSGNKAAGWFQDRINNKFKDKFGTEYFAPVTDGKNPYKRDQLFGQVTYSVPRFFDNPPPVPEQQKEEEVVVKEDIAPQQPRKEGPWWLQDIVNFTGAMTDQVNRYEPTQGKVALQTPGYVTEDPTRRLAANQEQMNKMQSQTENTVDGNVGLASMMGFTGQGFANAANTLGDVENRNVGIVNQAYLNNAQIKNQEAIANENGRQKYVEDMATLNQQEDIANQQKKWRQIAAFNNGTTNWFRKKQMEQVLFPQVYIDPIMGDAEFSGVGRDPLAPDTYHNPVFGAGAGYNPEAITSMTNKVWQDTYKSTVGTRGEESARKAADNAANMILQTAKQSPTWRQGFQQAYTNGMSLPAQAYGGSIEFPWEEI